VLKVERLQAKNTVIIRFRCLASRTYAVQWRAAVAAAPWKTLAGIPAVSSSGAETRDVEVVDADGLRYGQRYYRLVTPGISGD